MAVFNGKKYLADQMQSLMDQTYSDFQITVRDNHSTDNTRTLLEKWQNKHPEKITCVFGKNNLGILGNYASLLESSQASYVFLCDSDDVWLPDKVQKSIKAMKEAEEAYGSQTPLLIHTDLRVVDETLQSICDSFWQYSHLDGSQPITLTRALTENRVTGCTMMLNRALIDLANPIPLKAPMHDAWIALVAAAFGQIIPIPEATVLYRQHGDNATGAGRYSFAHKITKFLGADHRKQISAVREKRTWQAKHFFGKIRWKIV